MYLSCISNLLNIEIPINYYEPVCRSVFQIFHEFVSPPLCDSLDLETWYFIQSSTLTNFLNFYAMYEKNNDSLIRELLDVTQLIIKFFSNSLIYLDIIFLLGSFSED